MNNDIYIRDWMKQCPYVMDDFAKRNKIKSLEYGIYPSPVQTFYHENVLGELVTDEIQEANFVLTAEVQYLDGNAQRYSFFQNVTDWINEQNKRHNFPRLNEGYVRSVKARLAQYVSEPNRNMERNEIQMQFTYKRKSS